MKKLKLHELNRVSIEEYQEVNKVPLIVVLDNIRSALNVGSIFRTSDAMAISRIYICGISATPPNKEITKTAIGATDAVEWEYFESTRLAIDKLKKDEYEIVAIEQTDASVELMNFKPSKEKVAVILGNEVNGVDTEVLPMLDGAIEIDQFGTKHSLNVSVCGGIVLHHLASMMRK